MTGSIWWLVLAGMMFIVEFGTVGLSNMDGG